MRLRAILPLISLLLVACLGPTASPTTPAAPAAGFPRTVLKGHTDAVYSVAWSPDGKRLASGSADYTSMLWDVASGRPLATFKGQGDVVASVAWSPDGRQLASGCKDHTIRVWDTASGKSLLELKRHVKDVTAIAWSPDGRKLASASEDNYIYIWDLVSGKSLLQVSKGDIGTSKVTSLAWSPDGQRLASGDVMVRIWDAAVGRILHELPEHTGGVTSLAWCPDGRRLSSARSDGTIRVWDTTSSQALLELKGHVNKVTSVAWSPDGRRLASGSEDSTLRIWDTASVQSVLELKGRIHLETKAVAWSPDGQRLASGARIWDAASGQSLLALQGPIININCMVWSPDGRRLASGSYDSIIRIWDAASGQRLSELKGHTHSVTSVAWSPDGRRLASSSLDNTLRIWDTASEQILLELKGHATFVTSVAWSSDSRRLASGSTDGTIRIWDADGHSLLEFKAHSVGVNSVAWSTDGPKLASAGDKTIRIWDTTSGRNLLKLEGHVGSVTSVAWSSDNRRLASGSQDRTIRIWDADGGQSLLELKGNAMITTVAWSPITDRLASGNWDNTIRIWDAPCPKSLLELKGNSNYVSVVSWSPDGRKLASRSDELEGNAFARGTVRSTHTICVWDAANGRCLLEFKGSSDAGFLANGYFVWSPDGQKLASNVGNKYCIWDSQTGVELEQVNQLPHWADVDNVLRSPFPHSPDGKVVVYSEGKALRLVPLRPDPEEIIFRQEKSRFDPLWAEQQAQLAEKSNNAYASQFFRLQLAEAMPTNLNNWDKLILACGNLGDFRQVLEVCNRQLTRDPYLAPVYHQRAKIRTRALDLDGARNDMLTAALVRPNDINGWPEYAQVAFDRREYDLAWRWQPNNFGHGHDLAWQQLTRGKTDQFRATCREMVDRFSKIEDWKNPILISAILADGLTMSPNLSRGCGQLVAEEDVRRRRETAAATLIYTAAIDPDCAGLDAKELLVVVKDAFSEDAGFWWYQQTLGALHFRAGNFAVAIGYLERAAKQRETQWQRLFLAMAHHRFGNAVESDEWFKKATNPKEKAPQLEEFLIWSRLGQEARKMLKR
ncbi:MAG TPA: WD40 repeat domain-containing protein [Gemmata sp.]|nr:WD40 repeat domain-containing protein [Gemmata sp.]